MDKALVTNWGYEMERADGTPVKRGDLTDTQLDTLSKATVKRDMLRLAKTWVELARRGPDDAPRTG